MGILNLFKGWFWIFNCTGILDLFVFILGFLIYLSGDFGFSIVQGFQIYLLWEGGLYWYFGYICFGGYGGEEFWIISMIFMFFLSKRGIMQFLVRIFLHSNHALLSATFSKFKSHIQCVFKSFFVYFVIFPVYYRVFSTFLIFNKRDFDFFTYKTKNCTNFSSKFALLSSHFFTFLKYNKCVIF